jgi:hypothetical protein
MHTFSDRLIDAMGGTSALSGMSKIAPSTIHSWRKKGIPEGRLDHLKLIAEREGMNIDWDTGELVHDKGDDSSTGAASPGSSADISQQVSA